MMIELKRGLGKDGNPNFPYIRKHPTHYRWADRMERFTHRLVNDERWRREIWVNTYEKHPPALPRPKLSFDVWGFGGRGDPLPKRVGQRVFNRLFFDPNPPHIWWIIYEGVMWWRHHENFSVHRSPMPQDALDNAHEWHIHETVFDWKTQQDLIAWLKRRSVREFQAAMAIEPEFVPLDEVPFNVGEGEPIIVTDVLDEESKALFAQGHQEAP